MYCKFLVPTCAFIFANLMASIASAACENTLNEQKRVAGNAMLLWQSGSDLNPADILADGYTNHLDSAVGTDTTSQTRDAEAFKNEIDAWHEVFDDMAVELQFQVAEGDMVASRARVSAKNIGSLADQAPTGKTVTWDSVEFTRIENCKVVETWVTWDKYAVYDEVGAIQVNK